jgi:hypothetical protein
MKKVEQESEAFTCGLLAAFHHEDIVPKTARY